MLSDALQVPKFRPVTQNPTNRTKRIRADTPTDSVRLFINCGNAAEFSGKMSEIKVLSMHKKPASF
jgi:hypothetical protein